MAVDPARMRSALSRFVSGVTVVTAAQGAAEQGEVHGMTANSFTSVSLDPPLVLVSVATTAKLDRWIAETRRYAVSILSGTQLPLSVHFAGGTQDPALVRMVWRDGLPVLDGALVQLTCSVRASYRAGDHTLHIGELDEIWCQDGDPLIFHRGRLRALELVPEQQPSIGIR